MTQVPFKFHRMKKLIFTLLICLSGTTSAWSQPLIAGVYNNVTLAASSVHSYTAGTGCYDFWYTLEYNVAPPPSGMTLYLRVDSIHGADSVKFWRSLDMPGYRFMHPHDTVAAYPTVGLANDIIVYFVDTGWLYASLIMVGIPDSVGQRHPCSYSYQIGLVVDDPCTNIYGKFYGGSGPLDTTTCPVLSAVALGLDAVARPIFTAYPNPANDVLNLSGPAPLRTVIIMNMLGQELMSYSFADYQAQVGIAALPSGAYIARINKTAVIRFMKE